MKKLIFILLVLLLLSAPAIAQAHSDGKCKKDEASCATTQDDDRDDGDKDDHDRRDRDRGDRDGSDGGDQGRDGGNRDGGDGDDDDHGRGNRDGDGRHGDDDDDDKDKGRDRDDDDEDGEDRDDKEKKDKKDKDDRGHRPGDDDDDGDGEEPDDGDDDGSDDKPKKDRCRTINDGGITTGAGHPIVMGYDAWGYNYQAHSFNGWYENVDREGTPVETGNIRFKMKWNDVYLSNKDCDGDGHLDRHYGYDSYYGTRAWLTNKYMWSYIGDDGNPHTVHWFLKMVAQPYQGFSCASVGGTPFNTHFCVVKNVYYDPYGGSQGIAALISGFGIGAK